jgi:hypothetical protein
MGDQAERSALNLLRSAPDQKSVGNFVRANAITGKQREQSYLKQERTTTKPATNGQPRSKHHLRRIARYTQSLRAIAPGWFAGQGGARTSDEGRSRLALDFLRAQPG